ncbi:hypothetical protein EYF80_062636 [Liparis tanakae]|uniref:Uncharacterized protein n=1 Tax=Liparis tanakae TaxID=230148 RepID=A0A4Z2EEU4_9TELE|nr:hypothetical protein EYF80_062636 [Liparis tanakae]
MLTEGKGAYDENIHYPLLITLTKGPQPLFLVVLKKRLVSVAHWSLTLYLSLCDVSTTGSDAILHPCSIEHHCYPGGCSDPVP